MVNLFMQEGSSVFLFFLIILAVWEIIWKLIAMWKAARNNHTAWFICIALINTLGILPIIYVLVYRKKKDD